jgi:glycosyl transferase family 2
MADNAPALSVSASGATCLIPETATVCVTSCGRLDLLAQTLSSFRAFNVGGKYLISEDSTDASVVDQIKKTYPDATVLSGPERLGLMGSIDRLYSRVETKYLFHLEDDWEFNGPIAWQAAIEMLDVRADVAHVCVRDFAEVKPKYQARSEPATAGGREFRIMDCDSHPEFFAWSSNPGLMALSTYRRYAPFGRLMHDQMSGRMKRDGLRQAFLLPGVTHHIGQGRNVADPQMPARPRSRPEKWLRAVKKRLYYAGLRRDPF